jgi:polyribonucleotide 5'-hydroxyl-kinase
MNSSKGERIMIVGNVDTGKSTLCKILTSWTIRLGKENPYFIDLDVGQNQISIPGTISCVQLQDHIDIEEGFSLSSPLSFFYGHESADKNLSHYKGLMEQMASFIHFKQEKEPKNGVYINTCGWIENGGYSLILHAAKSFKVDEILVMDNDLLASKLSKDFPKLKIEKIIKSGGVVSRNKTFRKSTRMNKVREYFYGMEDILSPHTLHLKFEDVEIGQIGATSVKQTPSFLLPIGQKSSYDPTEIQPVMINEQLMHSILAVSQANDMKDISKKPVYGYV